MTNATYFIPTANEGRFLDAIKALAKRAAKLGCVAISAVAVHALAVPYRRRIEDELTGETTYRTVLLPCTAYTVEGSAPVIEGWALVATIEHEGGVNILRSISEEPLPQRFREVGPETCDHCGFVRDRKDTYVVRNTITGEYKQVGRSCLKDFLGSHSSPAAIAAYAQALMDFDGLVGSLCDEEEGGFGLGGKSWAYDLVDFLAATAAVIDSVGWVSRSMAYENGGVSTADVVLMALDDAAKGKGDLFVSEVNKAEAAEAIEWANAQDATGNDYIHNLQAICELGYVTFRTAGYAASIVSSMRRAAERRLTVEVVKADGNAHVGVVGKRGELALTLLGTRCFESQWGETCLHRFADCDGNLVIWWASNPHVVPEGTAGHEDANYSGKFTMVKGATYRVAATVKEHGEYQGQAQTVVTRISVQPLVKVKKARKARAKKVVG